MIPQKTKAVVLRKVAYGEGDWIVSLLTENGSKLTAFAPHARRSSKRFGGNLDLFNFLDVVYRGGKNGQMHQLNEVDLLEGMEGIRTDLSKFASACYFSELITLFLQEKESSPVLFESFFGFLKTLNSSQPFSPHLIPLMEHRFLAIFGFKPKLDSCIICEGALKRDSNCVFNGIKGGVVCSRCAGGQKDHGSHSLSYSAIEQILDGMTHSPETWSKLRWKKQDVSEARKALEFFIQYTAGKPLKSLRFLSHVISL